MKKINFESFKFPSGKKANSQISKFSSQARKRANLEISKFSSQARKRAVIEFLFTWLFALIVGVVILFLAIYFSVKLVNQGKTEIDAELGSQIGTLTNPLETGFEGTKAPGPFSVPSETRIYPICDKDDGFFGLQTLKISQKSFGSWSETNWGVNFQNKYIFSNNYSEGKVFYLFSKPFEFPFKVADLIYLVSEKEVYCFENAPQNVREEMESLNKPVVVTANCSKEKYIQVCGSGNCDVVVNLDANYVQKNGKKMYFVGDALMFAAIFSEKEMYECQVSRLMKRVEVLSSIYEDKSIITSSKECKGELTSSGEGSNLISLINLAKNAEKNPANIILMKEEINEIENKNTLSNCKLW